MEIAITTAAAEQIASHSQVAAGIERWMTVTWSATWRTILDVRESFPSASPVETETGRTAVVFNLTAGFRLITTISYPMQVVTVHYLLSHAEYDKNKWKRSL